jgi:hypothetical protein
MIKPCPCPNSRSASISVGDNLIILLASLVVDSSLSKQRFGGAVFDDGFSGLIFYDVSKALGISSNITFFFLPLLEHLLGN